MLFKSFRCTFVFIVIISSAQQLIFPPIGQASTSSAAPNHARGEKGVPSLHLLVQVNDSDDIKSTIITLTCMSAWTVRPQVPAVVGPRLLGGAAPAVASRRTDLAHRARSNESDPRRSPVPKRHLAVPVQRRPRNARTS